MFSKPRDLENLERYPSALYFGYVGFKNDPNFETGVLVTDKKTLLYYFWHPFELILYKFTDVGFALDRILLNLKTINKYEAVVAVNDSCGLPLGLLKIFGMVKPRIVMISAGLINNLEKISSRLYLRPLLSFYRLILKKMEVVFLWSNFEVETYKKFVSLNCKFLPLEIDTKFWKPMPTKKENFVLSVGRDLGRDFVSVAKATNLLGIPLVVVTNKKFAAELKSYSNVTIITKMIPYQELKKLYSQAICIVVGIKENSRISGQTSFIEAITMNKITVVSATQALASTYNIKNRGGIITYNPQNLNDIERAIKRALLESNGSIRPSLHEIVKSPYWLENGVTYKEIKKVLV
jgi:hypothetical protein